MNYEQTIEFLFNSLPEFQRVGAPAYKAGLSTSLALDEHLGNPHHRFRSVHIAGSNGKGSTSQMIYEALRAEGYSVGLYTSPHLLDFRERIIVDDEMISEAAVVEFVESNMEIIGALEPSFFEMTVAMAYWFFAKCEVDFAVVEVGMGGRLDSTNIITPTLSVITNISKDHTQFLGDTIEQIAAEKGGIIKNSVPVVIGQSSEAYNHVFEAMAAQCGSRIIFADSLAPQPYTPLMAGECQRFNAQTAVVALRELGLGEEAIKRGVESAQIAGRWQVIAQEPLTVCDTGHNEDGLRLVCHQIAEQKYQKLYFIIAVVADKDLDSVLPLLPPNAYYLFTAASISRAMSAEDLARKCMAYGLQGEVQKSVEDAYNRAKKMATSGDMIFIGGSTFTVADFLAFFTPPKL